MRKVQRDELLGLGAYEQIRSRFRDRIIALKKHRRVEVGQHMSLVFENHDTMLLQIQEMLRAERISDERAISHEIETYNEIIPEQGALSATLFIEYEDPDKRKDMLARFASLRQQVHLTLGARRITARFATHFGEELDRLPAVNYLTFVAGSDAAPLLRDAGVPVALEITHADYPVHVALSPALREELAGDLA